ncbi:MAG: hypothetical protein CL581_11935 [Alteromonadaceae bacterium]|nr:hypothetical protein [Alteromonadaceae bacterium]
MLKDAKPVAVIVIFETPPGESHFFMWLNHLDCTMKIGDMGRSDHFVRGFGYPERVGNVDVSKAPS